MLKSNVKYGNLRILVFILFLGIAGITKLQACDFNFSIENAKDTYKKGDVVIVKVKVVFTHRVCSEGINATKFNYKGMKVLGATKWIETSIGTWERKLKIEITDKGDALTLQAVRTCDKDGGSGRISFKVS